MTGTLKTSAPPNRKWTSLEMADQMFKDAFVIKKTRFAHLNPHLSDEELQKVTAEYFRKLNEEKSR